jgi:alpha-N-arabinofuranosidase
MYVPFQDATSVPVSFDGGHYEHGDARLPGIDAIAARDKDGKLWLAITNVNPQQPVTAAITSEGNHFTAASGETLVAPRIDSVNTFDAPHTVEPRSVAGKAAHGTISLRLAPASVTVLRLQ